MKTVRNVAAGAALTAALAGGGMYLAMAAPDSAATSTTLSASQHKGGHQANGITEQVLTGDTAARVEAAAKAAHPGPPSSASKPMRRGRPTRHISGRPTGHQRR